MSRKEEEGGSDPLVEALIDLYLDVKVRSNDEVHAPLTDISYSSANSERASLARSGRGLGK